MSIFSRQKINLYGRIFVIFSIFILLITGIINMSCDNTGSRPNKDSENLSADLARLEIMVDRAEAIRSVKRLQYAYGHYAEFGLWDDLADLFSEERVGHYPPG